MSIFTNGELPRTLFSVNYAVTHAATARITIRLWCTSVPDPWCSCEHLGILLQVVHKPHHYAAFCMMPSSAPMLLIGAPLEFVEIHF
jgi:hypothetical protein